MRSKHGFETTQKRSDLMRKIRSTHTKPEVLLRKALWSVGIRYRLNVPNLPGKPDIVIRKSKLVIFVDGEFWHGFKWKEKSSKLKSNREYWIKKIEGNVARDKRNQGELKDLGFKVIRFWEHEINRNLTNCVSKVIAICYGQNGGRRDD